MTVNPSGWRPTTPANEQGEAADRDRQPRADARRAVAVRDRHDASRPASISPSCRNGATAPRRPRTHRARSACPGLSEPETVRHYTRLSRQNYAIDLGLFPLGSCTMKHNPRLNEKVARLPGLRRRPPAAAAGDGPGRASGHRRARLLAARAHRHARRGDEPQGRRPRRAVRAALHPRGARSARRQARGRAGARERARHQPRDRRLRRLSGREHSRQRRRARRPRSA